MKIGKYLCTALIALAAYGIGCSTAPNRVEKVEKRAEFVEAYRDKTFEEKREAVESLFLDVSMHPYIKGVNFIQRPAKMEEVANYEGLNNMAFPDRMIAGNELMLATSANKPASDAILNKGAQCIVYIFDDIFGKNSPVETKADITALVREHEFVHCDQYFSGFRSPLLRSLGLVYMENDKTFIDGDLYIGISESEAYANFIAKASAVSENMLSMSMVEYAYVHYPRAIVKITERAGAHKAKEFAEEFFPSYLLRAKGVISYTDKSVSYQFFPDVRHSSLPFGEVFKLPDGITIGELNGKVDTKDKLTLSVH